MANEFVTNSATVAGLMERVQARINAGVYRQSIALNSFIRQNVNGALGAQFYAIPAPSATTEYLAGAGSTYEDDQASAAAVTIAARAANLSTFPSVTKMSNMSIYGGQGVTEEVVKYLTANVIAGIDTAGFAQFTNFTDNVDAVASITSFKTAIKTLINYGYQGQMKCVISPDMWNLITAGVQALYAPVKNDEIMSSYYAGDLLGVQVFVAPEGWLPTQGSSEPYGAMWIDGVGMAVAAREPVVDVNLIQQSHYWDVAAVGYAKSTYLSATGGVKLYFSES